MSPRPPCGNNTPMQSLSKWGFICHSSQNQFTPSGCSFNTSSVSDCSFTARQAIIDQLLDYFTKNSIKREERRTHSEEPDQKYICLKKKKKSPRFTSGLTFCSSGNNTTPITCSILCFSDFLFFVCTSMCKKRIPACSNRPS